jgi:hypothetical protein
MTSRNNSTTDKWVGQFAIQSTVDLDFVIGQDRAPAVGRDPAGTER